MDEPKTSLVNQLEYETPETKAIDRFDLGNVCLGIAAATLILFYCFVAFPFHQHMDPTSFGALLRGLVHIAEIGTVVSIIALFSKQSRFAAVIALVLHLFELMLIPSMLVA